MAYDDNGPTRLRPGDRETKVEISGDSQNTDKNLYMFDTPLYVPGRK